MSDDEETTDLGSLWDQIRWNEAPYDGYTYDKIQEWIENRIRQIVREELGKKDE